MQSVAFGAAIGVAGGLAGTFAGYKARTGLVRALKVPDIGIALLEDAVAIGGSFIYCFPVLAGDFTHLTKKRR